MATINPAFLSVNNVPIHAPTPVHHSNRGHARNLSTMSLAPGRAPGGPQSADYLQIQIQPDATQCWPSTYSEPFIYDKLVEQELCTGYECCNVRLDSLHAVLQHNELCHSINHFNSNGREGTQLPQVPPARLVIPQPRLDYDAEMASAPSPMSSQSSDRARSLSIPDDDAEFDLELETPCTPPAYGPHSHSVHVVSEQSPIQPHGFQQSILPPPHHPYAQHYYAPVHQQQYMAAMPQQKPASPMNPAFGAAKAVVAQAFAAQAAAGRRPIGPLDVDTDENMDTGVMDHDAQLSRQEPVYFRPMPVPNAAPVYPVQQQQLQQRAQVVQRPALSRQSTILPATQPPALVPARANSVHEFAAAPQQPSYPARAIPEPVQHRPIAPTPTSPHSAQQQFNRPNVSIPFPSQIVPPTLYSPEKGASPDYDGQDDGEYEDDEDADGEDEQMPALGQAYVPDDVPVTPTTVRPPAARKSTSSASREKRSKTGRPKATGRAAVNKDPRRPRLRCPKPGCTKLYMNPNGLKYHLEKGTCTIEA